MKRDFLKELGIEDAVIDKIMAEHGKTVEKQKSNTEKEKQDSEKVKAELEEVKVQLEEANTQIQGFKDMDIEGVKKSADDWKAKYEADTKALKEKQSKMEYDFGVKEYLSQFDFVSDFTKKAFIEEFKSKEFKFEEGKFLGADDFINNFKESNEGVFKAVEDTQKTTQPYHYEPQGSGEGTVDLAAQALNAVLGI